MSQYLWSRLCSRCVAVYFGARLSKRGFSGDGCVAAGHRVCGNTFVLGKGGLRVGQVGSTRGERFQEAELVALLLC